MAKKNNNNDLGAMMAAQNELSNINSARVQNSQAEQAFLQQQAATNETMMQAAQIGTMPTVGTQVGGMNPQTQAILAQYGITGTPTPGKSTKTSRTTQTGGNIKIENKTTNNHEVKIINTGGATQSNSSDGNQAKFQTWLSNAFAKQQGEYEIQKRAFARRDRDLEKQSNKMMRSLEKTMQGVSEKLNPENFTKPLGSQFKTLMFILMTSLIPKLIEPIGNALNKVEGTIRGAFGGDSKGDDPSNDPVIIKKLKRILGYTEKDYDHHRTIPEKIGEIVGKAIDRIRDLLNEQMEDRRNAIRSVEKPKSKFGGKKDAAINILRLGDWVKYLGEVVIAGLSGTQGSMSQTSNQLDSTTKVFENKEYSKERQSEINSDHLVEAGYMDKLSNSDRSITGDLKNNVGVLKRAAGSIAKSYGQGNFAEHSLEIRHVAKDLKKKAARNGEIPLGSKARANNFLRVWSTSVDQLMSLGKEHGKTYIREAREAVIWYIDENGVAVSERVPEGDAAAQQRHDTSVGSGEFKYEYSYYLTKEGFEFIEQELGFEFDNDKHLGGYLKYVEHKQKEYNAENGLSNEVNFNFTDEQKKLIDRYKNLEVLNTDHEAKVQEIKDEEGADKAFVRGLQQEIIDPLTALTKEAVNKAREAFVTSPFGMRTLSIGGQTSTRMHSGIDLRASIGTSVYAPEDGKVIHSGWSRGYGQLLILEHPDGTITRYAHLQKGSLLGVGTQVHKGDIIALTGNTGKSTGPHLHYEVRRNNTPVNPAKESTYHYDNVLIPTDSTEVEEGFGSNSQDSKSTPVEISEGEIYRDKQLGITAKIGDHQITLDEAKYNQLNATSELPSEALKGIYYSTTSEDGSTRLSPITNISNTESYLLNNRLDSELRGRANYEGKNTDQDILNAGFSIGGGENYLYLGKFNVTTAHGFSEIAYNQLLEDDKTKKKFIQYWVQLSKDAKIIRKIKLFRGFDTKRAVSSSDSTTVKSGEILYDITSPWSKEFYDFFFTTKERCNGMNPAMLYLKVELIPEAIAACNEIMRLLQGLTADGTGKLTFEGHELNDLEWEMIKNSGIGRIKMENLPNSNTEIGSSIAFNPELPNSSTFKYSGQQAPVIDIASSVLGYAGAAISSLAQKGKASFGTTPFGYGYKQGNSGYSYEEYYDKFNRPENITYVNKGGDNVTNIVNNNIHNKTETPDSPVNQ